MGKHNNYVMHIHVNVKKSIHYYTLISFLCFFVL